MDVLIVGGVFFLAEVGWSVHHSFAHVLARHDAIFLGGEVLVRVGEELKDFSYFVLFFRGDVVLFCEFGACALGGCGGGGGAGGSSAPLGRLWGEDVSSGFFDGREIYIGRWEYHDSSPGEVCAGCGWCWSWGKCRLWKCEMEFAIAKLGMCGGADWLKVYTLQLPVPTLYSSEYLIY